MQTERESGENPACEHRASPESYAARSKEF